MTFISYAQNFEDIRLWRALKHFENGFYIDVGANQPTVDSVTKAFYERGWTGINIEPVQVYHDALCQERPKDINLQCVAGDNAEALTFYAIADTGLSTVEASVAKQHRDAGKDVRSHTVHSRTLTSICEEHVKGPIHFLKIDVEGHEETVLRGMDFSQWRPWIILIETLDPRPDLGTTAARRRLPLGAVRRPQHLLPGRRTPALQGRLRTGPCNLDEFQFCYGHSFSYP